MKLVSWVKLLIIWQSRLQTTLKDSLDKQNKLEAILKSMDSGVIAVDKNIEL